MPVNEWAMLGMLILILLPISVIVVLGDDVINGKRKAEEYAIRLFWEHRR